MAESTANDQKFARGAKRRANRRRAIAKRSARNRIERGEERGILDLFASILEPLTRTRQEAMESIARLEKVAREARKAAREAESMARVGRTLWEAMAQIELMRKTVAEYQAHTSSHLELLSAGWKAQMEEALENQRQLASSLQRRLPSKSTPE